MTVVVVQVAWMELLVVVEILFLMMILLILLLLLLLMVLVVITGAIAQTNRKQNVLCDFLWKLAQRWLLV